MALIDFANKPISVFEDARHFAAISIHRTEVVKPYFSQKSKDRDRIYFPLKQRYNDSQFTLKGIEKNQAIKCKEEETGEVQDIHPDTLRRPLATPKWITKLLPNEVFVFGSNYKGIHGAGAAKMAGNQFKAVIGVAEGMTGKCYAILTKAEPYECGLPVKEIGVHVKKSWNMQNNTLNKYFW